MPKSKEKHFFGNVTQKALIVKDNKILLVQYPLNSKKVAGRWDMPGGRLNLGEDSVTGLKREVFEELGLNINIEKILKADSTVNYSGDHFFFLVYQASLVDSDTEFILEKEEIGNAGWFSLEEISSIPIVYPEYLSILSSILV